MDELTPTNVYLDMRAMILAAHVRAEFAARLHVGSLHAEWTMPGGLPLMAVPLAR